MHVTVLPQMHTGQVHPCLAPALLTVLKAAMARAHFRRHFLLGDIDPAAGNWQTGHVCHRAGRDERHFRVDRPAFAQPVFKIAVNKKLIRIFSGPSFESGPNDNFKIHPE